MGLEASKKERREPIIIEVMNYDNLEVVLSKIIIPFSEVMGTSSFPDVYVGHEKNSVRETRSALSDHYETRICRRDEIF